MRGRIARGRSPPAPGGRGGGRGGRRGALPGGAPGAVQAEIVADLLDALGRGGDPADEDRGVAGDEAEQGEREEGDAEHEGDEEEQATQDEVAHGRNSLLGWPNYTPAAGAVKRRRRGPPWRQTLTRTSGCDTVRSPAPSGGGKRSCPPSKSARSTSSTTW